MIDRFGTPPEEVRTLVELERIRALASRLYIEEILEENNKINIKITSQCTISPDLLLKSISSDKRFTINPKYPEILQFTPGKIPIEKKLMEIKKWLQQFLILS